jgi:hypothetical protein
MVQQQPNQERGNRKMAMKKLWSLNQLSIECGRNFRTLAKALSAVKPDATVAGKARWHLQTAIAALTAHERRMELQTGRVLTRPAPEKYDPKLEAQIATLEAATEEVDRFLKKLRAEPTVEGRRMLLQGGAGRCIGAFDAALQATVGDDGNAFLRKAFCDGQMGQLIGEVDRSRSPSATESAAITSSAVTSVAVGTGGMGTGIGLGTGPGGAGGFGSTGGGGSGISEP